MYKSQALRSSTSLGQIVIYLLSTAATASISAISLNLSLNFKPRFENLKPRFKKFKPRFERKSAH